jgi:hypothetical protein
MLKYINEGIFLDNQFKNKQNQNDLSLDENSNKEDDSNGILNILNKKYKKTKVKNIFY